MRKKIRSCYRVNYIHINLFLVLFLILNILISPYVISAKGENLQIQAVDEITESEFFTVSVLDPEDYESETPFLLDVTINFNGENYLITDENGEISLLALEVDQDKSFLITASKDGYYSTNKMITILDNSSNNEPLELVVYPEFYTVEAGNQFAVFVKDEDGNVISGVKVAIQSFGSYSITDDVGKAWLKAPKDKDSATIIAEKDGYIDFKHTDIKINIPPNWWETFVKSQYFPIFIAVIILLFAILFVSHRQKKSIYNRASEITQEQTLKKYNLNEENISTPIDKNKEELNNYSSLKANVRIKPDQDSKVEEIRITRPRKEKEVVPVESKEDETEKVIKRNKMHRQNYDWFEGTDDIRYEIDKLTGKIDEEHVDKWFEGVDNLKEKIDEKVRKKDKKKEKENDY